MSVFMTSNSGGRRLKGAIAIAVLGVSLWALAGCGGYRAPSGSGMPGQQPRTYPGRVGGPVTKPGSGPMHK